MSSSRSLLLLAALASCASAYAIDGRVVQDRTGAPLASVEVRIAKTGVPGLIADLETDAAGRFTLPDLTAGEYRIEASKPNHAPVTLRFHAPVPAGLLIRLVRCGAIVGQVSDQEGRPVHGATVVALLMPAGGQSLLPPASYRRGSYAAVDELGQYRLFDLPPGKYVVAASYGASTISVGSLGAPAGRARLGSGVVFYPNSARPQVFTLSGGEEIRDVNLTVAPGPLVSVSGKVELPSPNARFWLALTSTDQPGMAFTVAAAEPDGRFRFEAVAAGSYTLLASGPTTARLSGRAMLSEEPFFGRARVEVGAENLEGLSIVVQKGRAATILLRQQPGCPATAQLTLAPEEDWAAVLDRTVEVSAGKEQVLERLAPARYRVRISKLGGSCYQAEEVVLDLSAGAPNARVTVVAAPAASIRGRLTGTVKPAEFVVALVGADPAEATQPVQIAMPDADSHFTFDSLRPGRYYIAAQPAREISGARWVPDLGRMFEIEVPGGAATEMDLPVPAAP